MPQNVGVQLQSELSSLHWVWSFQTVSSGLEGAVEDGIEVLDEVIVGGRVMEIAVEDEAP